MAEIDALQEDIRRLEARGDFLQAYDRARQALAEFPDDPQFKYLAVRALARSGATQRALAFYSQFALDAHDTLDFQALGARLEKDAAMSLRGIERQFRLRHCAERYASLHERFGGHYPAVNAATLHLLAGQFDVAKLYARKALQCCAIDAEKGAPDAYFRGASEAEAYLVLGETLEAMKALHKLASISRGDLAAQAATRRQLRMILDLHRLNDSILDPLSPPLVLHYTGHMMASDGDGATNEAERAIAAAVAREMSKGLIGFAYGSLACGSDILFAEECLRRGIELNLFLPFAVDEFKAVSVAPGGESWLARFEAVLAAANSVTLATEGDYLGDDALFAYCAELAMGRAILRASHIDSTAVQVAVSDGRPPTGPAGAAADIAKWQASGRETRIVRVQRDLEDRPSRAPARTASPPPRRELRALIFGDTAGFGGLPERLLPVYRRAVLGGIAEVVSMFGEAILAANSWGDAVYLVASDAATGARCALAIQERLRSIDFRALRFPDPVWMRLSVHYGPAFPTTDELTSARTYYGKEVTFAARMEPVTPPGEVYATEELASQLALTPDSAIAIEYVGRVPLAKQFGTAPMYLLRDRIEE